MKKTYHLTLDGKAELEQELVALVSQRKDIAERIANARSQGDLSENSEYDSAREEQGLVETRIAEIEDILKNADIITANKPNGVVELGDNVTVKADGKTLEFTVVGPVEADPIEGKISNESPLGAALLGKKQGEKVTVTTPRGDITYEIVSTS